MRIKQTWQLSSAVRAVNNVLSAAIANRARRLRHAPSSELRAETFVNSDCVECNYCVICRDHNLSPPAAACTKWQITC